MKITELKEELILQLELFQEIYKETELLATICSNETPDQNELDRILLVRQKLINQTSDSQKKLQTFLAGAQACYDLPDIKNILLEIRSVLEKTALLDEGARKVLEQKQNVLKNQLFRIQNSKKAEKVYHAPVKQNEGYFIDSRKN